VKYFGLTIACVKREELIGVRVSMELKQQLEQIAAEEERTLSKLCEMLLRAAVASYKKEGREYLKKVRSK
jgi:predicted transcriptional regulator